MYKLENDELLTEEIKNAFKRNVVRNKAIFKGENRGNIKLPDEYQEVEYLESTGTQWIDTGVKLSDYYRNLIFSAEFQATNLNVNSIVGGCRLTEAKEYFFPVLINSTNFQSNSGKGDNLEITIGNSDTKRHKFISNSFNGECSLDDNKYKYINSEANCNINIYLFAFNSDNTSARRTGNVRLYSIKMQTNNNILIRDFIPCYRKSDNKPRII